VGAHPVMTRDYAGPIDNDDGIFTPMMVAGIGRRA
jgi:hypothetical protein